MAKVKSSPALMLTLDDKRKQKIRELEAENAMLKRALDTHQMLFTIGEN